MTSHIESALRQVGERTSIPFAARFTGGGQFLSREARPEFTLVFRNARAYRRIALFGYVGLLEAYFDGDIDIDGSLAKCMAAGMEGGMTETPLVRLLNWWHEFLYSNSDWMRSKRNAEFHYAHNTEFYRLWLDDPLMLYTCAYWTEGTRTLEEAQRNKLDHVARKLLLKPGEEVLDIGSGFGGFLLYAQERYGVNVTGVNPTGAQVEMVRREIERRRIGHSARMLAEYSEIAGRQFDKIASIGSLEHAGRDHLPEVIRRHARLLKPGGVGMLHFIGHVGRFPTDYFIRKYVFPGGWIPSLADTIVEMERAGLEVLDIENLRRHYALTLDVWAERFDRNWERIRALGPKTFDERFRRIWRVYLYGCAEMFRSPAGYTHLFQIVFSKGNTTSYPMTRGFLYEREPAHQEKRSAGRAA